MPFRLRSILVVIAIVAVHLALFANPSPASLLLVIATWWLLSMAYVVRIFRARGQPLSRIEIAVHSVGCLILILTAFLMIALLFVPGD